MTALMTIDFYAYWNGTQVAELFSTIAGLTNTSDYITLLKCCAILSLAAAVTMACVRNRGGDIITWFGATILFFMIAFVPRVNMNVVDVRALSARTVENVPIGVGFTAGLSSSVGKWLAEAFETAFTDVDAARFTKFGAAFPERVVAAIQKAGPILPETRALLEPFVEHCVTPELLDDNAKLVEVMTSTSLLSTIGQSGWVNPSRFILSSGKPLYCDAALSALRVQLSTKEMPAQEKLLMTRLTGSEGKDAGNGSNAGDSLIEAAIRKAIPEAQALLLGTSRSMEESLEHSMLMTAIPAGVLRAADRHDSPIAASVQLSKSQGNMASEIAFRTMSEIASAFLPKLRNILEFIVIAAFPVVFLLVVATGAAGGIAIRAYFTLFVWLMLWAPLAVIVNYLLVHIDANPMNRLVEQFGGVTLQSADLIRDLGASSQAMAGYVMLLIPVVAFMLARASEMSASSLAASVIAPASGAAQSQSANLAMGNVSSGNASLSNVSVGNANTGKSDYSDAFTSGQVSKSTTPYGTVVRDGSTGAVTAMRVEQSNLGFTSQEILSHGEARESASTSGASTAFTQGYGYSDSKASTTTQAQGTTTIESQSRVLNQSSGSMNNNSQVKATGENVSYGESSSFGRHANTSEGLSYQSSLGLEAVAHRMGKDNVPNTEAEPIQRQETYQGILSPSSQAYLTEYPVVDSDKNIIADKRSPKQNYHGSNKKISVPGKFGFTVNSSVGHSDQSTDLSTSSNYLTESSQNIQTISAFKNTSLNDSNNISSASDNRLTNSYSDSKNGSTSFTSSKSENSALVDSERKQQTSSSVIATDRSPGILRQLNDEFSSSEEALQWLSNAENRKAFSSALLNGTIPAMDHSAINSAFAKNNSFVTQQQAEILAQTVSEKTSNTSKNFIPLKIHPAVSLSNPSNANSISDSSFFQRGLMKLTNASFDNEAISMSGIGSLVIPAIFKYESPERRF